MRPRRRARQDEGKRRAKAATSVALLCTQRRGSRHHNRILVKSLRISGCRSNVPYYNTHQDSESTAKLANSVNFVASGKKIQKKPKKHPDMRQHSPPTHFFRYLIFSGTPPWRWLCAPCGSSLCFAFSCLSFPPLSLRSCSPSLAVICWK